MPDERIPSVFTPSNEPYLGRQSVHALDDMIVAALELNRHVAPRTHQLTLTTIQSAACQLIPQNLSLALATRELVRQGYLFGALVLTRPLFERVAILLYLEMYPESTAIWQRGWQHREAPSLSEMVERLGGHDFSGLGPEFTAPFNALLHGKPDSALWTLVPLPGGKAGHGVSKILDNPSMCDKICVETAAILAIVTTLMASVFPAVDAA